MRSVGSLVLLTALVSPAQPAADFFETQIRPLFAEECYSSRARPHQADLSL